MSVDPKTVDPAVVATQLQKTEGAKPAATPKPAPPMFPISAAIIQKNEEDEEAPFAVNWATHCVVATSDEKFVTVLRTSAAKLPVIAAAVAAQSADDHTVTETALSANAFVAINHWCEKVGAKGTVENAFVQPILYTEFTTMNLNDWEKDFYNRLLVAEGPETLFAVISFAEKNDMAGLLDFCVVALSCMLRGKSNMEMMHAMGLDCDDEFSEEELAAGVKNHAWFGDVTSPH
jgi:hypothetical protein